MIKIRDIKISLSDVPEQHKDLASFIGIEKFLEFCYLYGGSNIYIPTVKTLKNNIRNDDILDLYFKEKMTMKDISKKFNISPNYVRYILKKSLND